MFSEFFGHIRQYIEFLKIQQTTKKSPKQPSMAETSNNQKQCEENCVRITFKKFYYREANFEVVCME